MRLSDLGKYERVDVLGHGASGIVYLAWDTLLKKQVALKEIDLQAGDVRRFLEEARVMDRLQHPNIVRVNGVDLIDGKVVIDMELVKGSNLQEILRRDGALPIDRALRIAIQTLDALDYAHSMRTVHRDIKPANILIGRDDTVKLVDFGLAEILATNSYAGGAGTYAYMAPEDFAEEHRSDHQSDVWAVGVTLFEMLTATRPFNVTRPKDPFAWRNVLLHEEPARLALPGGETAPAELQAVLDKALARDKRARYHTAAEFRDDLIAIRDGRQPAAIPRPSLAYSNGNGSNGHSDATVLGRIWPPETPSSALPMAAPASAEGPAAEPARARPRLPLIGRRAALPAAVTAEPFALDLGEVRKGDTRTARVKLRLVGGAARPSAAVTGAPVWAAISPLRFDRRKQTLTVTAMSDQVWQTGDFAEPIRLETSSGSIEIPLTLRVLPARPTFSQVAAWFVPVFGCALLPALTVGVLARVAEARYLIPSAALGSGLLAAMLLLVTLAADLGIAERIASGLMVAVMLVVLGVVYGAAQRHPSLRSGEGTALLAGAPIALMLCLQALTRSHWKLWAAAIALLGLIASGAFVAALSS